MGRAVGELRRDELRREQLRCQTMLTAFGYKKGLHKRLREIESRLSWLKKAD
jgi:hypothetical protein